MLSATVTVHSAVTRWVSASQGDTLHILTSESHVKGQKIIGRALVALNIFSGNNGNKSEVKERDESASSKN